MQSESRGWVIKGTGAAGALWIELADGKLIFLHWYWKLRELIATMYRVVLKVEVCVSVSSHFLVTLPNVQLRPFAALRGSTPPWASFLFSFAFAL